MKGLLISLEGPDGCGKSTQIAYIKEFLEKTGYEVILCREPGGTKISEQIREVILDKDNREMDDVTEMLLYAAARAQLASEVIKPALQAGKIVICDRFVDSSAVYQGIARGLGIDTVYQVKSYALHGLTPDVTFLLDLPAEEGIRRKDKQHALDRMELETLSFHEQVAEGYRTLAKGQERIILVDAMQQKEQIRDILLQKLRTLL